MHRQPASGGVINRIFLSFYATSGEFIVIVFQTVNHSDSAVPDDNASGRVAGKGMGAHTVILFVHFKKHSHLLSTSGLVVFGIRIFAFVQELPWEDKFKVFWKRPTVFPPPMIAYPGRFFS
jgi:hypothetical protein